MQSPIEGNILLAESDVLWPAIERVHEVRRATDAPPGLIWFNQNSFERKELLTAIMITATKIVEETPRSNMMLAQRARLHIYQDIRDTLEAQGNSLRTMAEPFMYVILAQALSEMRGLHYEVGFPEPEDNFAPNTAL
jgi:hypothetical protein